MYKIPCQNCKGNGTLSHFKHVENGICFKCSGSGFQDANEKEYQDYLQQQEQIKKGLYILFNNGNVEYYKSEKQIINKYGTFFSGNYGYDAKISYNDSNIAYWNNKGNTDQIIEKANKHYITIENNAIMKKISRQLELLEDEEDQEFIQMVNNKIKELESLLKS